MFANIIKYFKSKFKKDDGFDDKMIDALNKSLNDELKNQESGLWKDTHPYTEKLIELNKWTEENIYSQEHPPENK